MKRALPSVNKQQQAGMDFPQHSAKNEQRGQSDNGEKNASADDWPGAVGCTRFEGFGQIPEASLRGLIDSFTGLFVEVVASQEKQESASDHKYDATLVFDFDGPQFDLGRFHIQRKLIEVFASALGTLLCAGARQRSPLRYDHAIMEFNLGFVPRRSPRPGDLRCGIFRKSSSRYRSNARNKSKED